MSAKRTSFTQSSHRQVEAEAQTIIEHLFREWLGARASIDIRRTEGVDFVARFPKATLLMELKSAATAPAVHAAIKTLSAHAKRNTTPVVVVPYMGEVGRRICAEAGVSWLDLSGNADIAAPWLRILSQGEPNRYALLGRPATLFAPKSSRLARCLLLHPRSTFSQRELANNTHLDPSQVSRLVGRLKENNLVHVARDGRIGLRDRRVMLEAWGADYEFRRHTILKGHVPGRDGPELATRLGAALQQDGRRCALTGLAGAWRYTHTAAFRLVTIFVDELPSLEWRRGHDFHEEERGSNVWLVVPEDAVVFEGSREIEGDLCMHPVQVWLDLQAQPERAQEASAALFERILGGEFDG